MSVRIVERAPTPAEYAELRAAVGWRALPASIVEAGLPRGLYAVCAEDDGRTIGCARIVGDGAMYFYLQDVLVHPEHQRRGVGGALMDALLDFLRRTARDGAFVGLMAAWNAQPFYERYGFTPRETGRPGMHRWWTAADEHTAAEATALGGTGTAADASGGGAA